MATASASASSLLETNYNSVLQDFVAREYIPIQANIGDEIIGHVAGGVDWTLFFVHPAAFDIDLLDTINGELNICYKDKEMPSLKDLDLVDVGMPCAVRYAKDSKWYRARLEDTNYNMVRFVDYGNVQLCAEEDIKALKKSFADLSTLSCIACTLCEAQDIALPSFTSENTKLSITILTDTDPRKVVVKILPPDGARQPAGTSTAAIACASALPARAPRRPCTATGLSLLPTIRPRFVDEDDDDDDPKRAALANTARSRSVPSRGPYVQDTPPMQQTNYSVTNGRGTLRDLYATCCQIAHTNYPAKLSEVNTQQTLFNGGPLLIDDLRRIFRAGDTARYNAKVDKPYVSQDMEWSVMVAEDNDAEMKKRKFEKNNAQLTRWLVTDFKLLSQGNVLITHAVVSFVSDQACSLYVRGSEESIWAPKGVFPQQIARSPRSLKDLVDIGRSVLVRAEPVDDGLVDFKINAPWTAKAVELVGSTFEEKGTMYLVRDNYSVIITEGNVGFGYAFISNRFVDAANVPMEEWYGTRVYFRSCYDIPDKGRDEARGIRMKALFASLVPEETKGPYRYPGIYRPSSVVLDHSAPGSRGAREDKEKEKPKKTVDDDNNLDLPGDTLEEMRVLGVDVVGLEAPRKFPVPEPIEVIRQNFRNERIMEEDKQRTETGGEGTSTFPKNAVNSNTSGQSAPSTSNIVDTAVIQENDAEEGLDPSACVQIFIGQAPALPSPTKPKNVQPTSAVVVNGPRLMASTGTQTDWANLEEEEMALRADAIQEIRSFSPNELAAIAGFLPKLDTDRQQRFYDVLKLSMHSE